MVIERKEKYSEEVQKLFLVFLFTDDFIFSKCSSIIRKEYFHQNLRNVVDFVLKYSDQYKKLPSLEIITSYTGFRFDNLDLLELYQHKEWFFENFEKFIKHQAVTKVILESVERINRGDYERVEKDLKDALTIGLDKDLGMDYFSNPKERLERLRDRTNVVTTGWKSIDKKLFGGFGRGQINIFAGYSGTGKSLFLQNLTLNWALLGLNVVYFTLELSEELVALRLDAMLTGKSTKQIMADIDSTHHMVKTKKDQNKLGDIRIKYLPTGTTTNQLYAYLKEYQIEKNYKPDAIIVDYLDLMHPNDKSTSRSDLFVKDKYVTEELRSMVVDLNLLCCTASQLNRSAVDENEHNISHIAGGISKVNTADNVMTIYTSPSLRSEGKYRISFIKTRSSSGIGSTIELKYDPECMRITDIEENKDNDREEIGNRKKEKNQEIEKIKLNKEILSKINKTLKF